MSKVKQRFQASDGQDFGTKAAAERHNKSLELAAKLEECLRAINLHLGDGALTADGELFSLSNWTDYWAVRDWAGTPHLERVSVWAHDINFETDRENGELAVRVRHQDRAAGVYKLSELYADEREAKAALIVAYERHIAELQANLEKMRAATDSR